MARNGGKFAWIAAVALVAGCLLAGCKSQQAKKPVAEGTGPASKPAEAEEKHTAYHNGCLNAIGSCSVGHAEVKIEGDVLKCWFVGGENQTDTAVRATDKQIVLTVTPKGGPEKKLTLLPKPDRLADEMVGDCSYFDGKADWLADVTEFTATGLVNCKGQERKLTIEYPKGYDPD
jgi:hypothetical protein